MLDWRKLLTLSDAELAVYDVAAINLACAAGLPGSERIDYAGCLRALDDWAVGIGQATERMKEERFRTDPARYDHSEAVFRSVTLVTILQKHCGVVYDPARADLPPDALFLFGDEFVHAAIQGPGGTCATLPIVYAAVGRRLGYPIRLVKTKGHMFARWDDPETGERVNIEGACAAGMNTHPDDYYRQWPRPVSARDELLFGYLKSMSPREELANFVARRAHQLKDHRRYREAVETYIVAADLEVRYETYPYLVQWTTDEWNRHLLGSRPPGFPTVEITGYRETNRLFPTIPWVLEKKIRFLRAAEDVLNDPELVEGYWAPLRAGRPCRGPLPPSILVHCEGQQPCSTRP